MNLRNACKRACKCRKYFVDTVFARKKTIIEMYLII